MNSSTNNEAKHTPGEWEIEQGDLIVPRGGNGGCIAEVYGDTIEQRDANARLIAAAPDLLEACKIALAYLQANRPQGKIRDIFSALNEHENAVCKPLLAAITRAEGR